MTTKPKSDIGIALGTFDLFHAGHIEFFRQCKAHVRHLTVALNTDAFAQSYKRQPIYTLAERFLMVRECKLVDEVMINRGGEKQRSVILRSCADLIFHGDDWPEYQLKEQLCIDDEWMVKHSIEFCFVPYTPGISTSLILKRMKAYR